jgi:hypothetical protein
LQSLSRRGPADPKLKRQHAILDLAALRRGAANDCFAKRAVDKFAREAPLDEAGFDLRQLRPSSCATALRSSQVRSFPHGYAPSDGSCVGAFDNGIRPR